MASQDVTVDRKRHTASTCSPPDKKAIRVPIDIAFKSLIFVAAAPT
jgi:hypothetical protein